MLGTYRLTERIGAGGMGEVWKAEDTRLGRAVAIKILPPTVAADSDAIARMRREARTAAQLNHPNIATIFSFEEADGRTFIVMELVDGDSLTRLMASRTLSEADICRIGRGVAEALAEAHEKGIVHRDVKPDNVIVRGTRVKVLDFGIAKRIGVEATNASDPTAFVTQQGMILGTIHYMSPEQALGKTVDARTDLFSLGVVLYEAATGRLPFSGETITETITQIIRDEPQTARRVNPRISSGLNAIIERCLRKNRDERFPSAAALADALDRQLSGAATEAITGALTEPLPPLDGALLKTVEDGVPAIASSAAPTVRTGPAAVPARRGPVVQPKSSSRTVPIVVGAVVVLLVAAAGLFLPRLRSAISRSDAQVPQKAPAGTASAPLVAPARPASTSIDVPAPPVPPPATATTATATTSMAATAPAPRVPKQDTPETRNATGEPSREVPQPSTAGDHGVGAGVDVGALYAKGLELMSEGDLHAAREQFAAVLRADPHHAEAHFRAGEIALLNRNKDGAIEQLGKALENGDQLDPRERKLTELGLAIASEDRPEALRIAREIHAAHPFDPDLIAIHREYPGMLTLPDRAERPRRQFRRP